ncbi:alcohol acyltransferase 9-like [Magnolia sinica]|uniref:alcohol acyltransferase 9-like n=1 Tax=Magnolia sinica TaxID=86752 RepID=UPI00265887A1|nr:alcohol acyltransferase 9-like [Magnolia sinica]
MERSKEMSQMFPNGLTSLNLSSNLGRANLVQKCYRASQPFQAQLKQLAQSNGEDTCTTFDAVAAHVWRCWVKALDIRPLDYDLRLTFAINVRPKLTDPPLKDGFLGNAVCVACATSTVGQLVDGQISAVARLVREARLGMSEEYVRSTIDYIGVDRPTRLDFAGKLTITQWTRFSIYESSDFGYDRPVYAGPIDLKPTPQMCVFLPDGGPSPGRRNKPSKMERKKHEVVERAKRPFLEQQMREDQGSNKKQKTNEEVEVPKSLQRFIRKKVE